MARERTPLGKRVVIPVRVSEPMRDAIDKARGDAPRSVWIEEVIAAHLKEFTWKAARAKRAQVTEALLDDVAALAEPAPKARAKTPCEHRIPPGSYCSRCKRLI